VWRKKPSEDKITSRGNKDRSLLLGSTDGSIYVARTVTSVTSHKTFTDSPININGRPFPSMDNKGNR